MVNDTHLNLAENNLTKIEGEFELFPDTGYSKKGDSYTTTSKDCCNSFYSFVSKKETKFDSLSHYSVQIKLVNPEKIKFIFKKEKTIIDSLEIGGKLNKNGFFDLDNINLKRTGIPFLFGGYDSDKTRIGITKDNGLLVQHASAKFGGLLIVISLRTSCNTAFRFNRIENK